MKQDLLTRVFSAVVLILLMCMILFLLGQMGLFYLSCIFNLIVIFEFQKMTLSALGCSTWSRGLFVLTSIVLVCVLCFQGIHLELQLGILGVVVTLFLSVIIWLLRNTSSTKSLLSLLIFSLMGFFYVSLLPSYILKLLLMPNGTYWFGYLLVAVLSADTCSYFGGTFWGRRKLCEQISPHKTIEGSLCGIVGSLLIFRLFYLWFPIGVPLPVLYGAVFIGVILSQWGDLFESLIKRLGGEKDSGRLIPGHGGVLDRVDGILFAGPVFFTVATMMSTPF